MIKVSRVYLQHSALTNNVICQNIGQVINRLMKHVKNIRIRIIFAWPKTIMPNIVAQVLFEP